MAEHSQISWTDATFNPWMGCTKVGPGCDSCYAEALVDTRMHRARWGAGEPRTRTSDSNWKKVEAWDKHPEKLIGSAWPGRKPRVFAASLADIFDNEIDPAWRADFWALVRRTQNLQWLIVTKRIGNVAKMLPKDWGDGYSNVVLLITVVNQEEADRDIPKLVATPARWRGLSIEPMLGPIDLGRFLFVGPEGGIDFSYSRTNFIDWIIAGGESGNNPRPMEPAWAKLLRDQCSRAGVPFHLKQWGEWHPNGEAFASGMYGMKHDVGHTKIGKHRAGRYLDGIEHNGFIA